MSLKSIGFLKKVFPERGYGFITLPNLEEAFFRFSPQESTWEYGYGLVLFDLSSAQRTGKNARAKNVVRVNSNAGTSYLLRHYFDYPVAERSAIRRMHSAFVTLYAETLLDEQQVATCADNYFRNFSLDSLLTQLKFQVWTHVAVKIGDCDKFRAGISAFSPASPIVGSWPESIYASSDPYVSRLLAYYETTYEDEQFCSGYEMERFFNTHYLADYELSLPAVRAKHVNCIMESYAVEEHKRVVLNNIRERLLKSIEHQFTTATDAETSNYMYTKFPRNYGHPSYSF